MIEGCQAAVFRHRQSEKIDVCKLPMPVEAASVHGVRVQDRDRIRPKLVVDRGSRPFQKVYSLAASDRLGG